MSKQDHKGQKEFIRTSVASYRRIKLKKTNTCMRGHKLRLVSIENIRLQL